MAIYIKSARALIEFIFSKKAFKRKNNVKTPITSKEEKNTEKTFFVISMLVIDAKFFYTLAAYDIIFINIIHYFN